MDFYQTEAGKRYYNNTLPKLVRQLELLNKNIDSLHNRQYAECPATELSNFLEEGWKFEGYIDSEKSVVVSRCRRL